MRIKVGQRRYPRFDKIRCFEIWIVPCLVVNLELYQDSFFLMNMEYASYDLCQSPKVLGCLLFCPPNLLLRDILRKVQLLLQVEPQQ